MPLPAWPKNSYVDRIYRFPRPLDDMLNALWHSIGAKRPDSIIYKSDLVRLAILEFCEKRKELLGDFDFETAKQQVLDLIKL